MTETDVFQLTQPGTFTDSLTEVLRSGARALLARAVDAEAAEFLAKHADLKTDPGAGERIRFSRRRSLTQLSGRKSRNATITGTAPRANVSDTRPSACPSSAPPNRSVSVVIVGLLQVSESIFKSVTACFALPQFVPKEVIYLLAPEKIFKCFVGKPTAPVATEAGSREQIIGHCSCRDESTRVCIITPRIGQRALIIAAGVMRHYATGVPALAAWRSSPPAAAPYCL